MVVYSTTISLQFTVRTWLARLAPPRGAVGFSWHSEARVMEGSLTGPLALYQVPGILTDQTHALLRTGSYKDLHIYHNRRILKIYLQQNGFKLVFWKMVAKCSGFTKENLLVAWTIAAELKLYYLLSFEASSLKPTYLLSTTSDIRDDNLSVNLRTGHTPWSRTSCASPRHHHPEIMIQDL